MRVRKEKQSSRRAGNDHCIYKLKRRQMERPMNRHKIAPRKTVNDKITDNDKIIATSENAIWRMRRAKVMSRGTKAGIHRCRYQQASQVKSGSVQVEA